MNVQVEISGGPPKSYLPAVPPRSRSALLALAFLGACTSAGSAPPGLDAALLDSTVGAIDERVQPGRLGVAVRDIETGDTWSIAGAARFPMQSVFKLPLGAFVLHNANADELSLGDTIRLTSADLSPPYSPISAAWPGRTEYTVRDLLVAAAGGSDNTAADVLMKLAGGPSAATEWLSTHGIAGMRIDRYEREFQLELNDMPPFQPEWANDSIFLARLNEVPTDRRREATRRYLEDPRDTSTPIAAVDFLERLARGELLPDSLTALLVRIATETTTGSRRIKAALPGDALLAHKTGSARPDQGMNPAINDIGIITLPTGRRIALAVFLSGSTMTYTDAEAVLADVARAVLEALR